MKKQLFTICAVLAVLSLTAACANAKPTVKPTLVPDRGLVVTILYPNSTSRAELGQNLKCIVKVLDGQGNVVLGAQVTLSVLDPSGKLIGSLPASQGSGDVYRTGTWTIPHRVEEGIWTIRAEVDTGNQQETATTTLRVKNSISEQLLGKYGFWIGAPTLKDIHPDLVKEQGDAHNGLIIWGGVLPNQHIFTENWLVIQWREGDFKLSTGDEVRGFMLGELGDLGFTPVRDLGPFEQVKFKSWDAWQVKARGQFSRYDEQWIIFYAPEARKTYAIGTTVVQAPVGIDPHAALRESFEVHPEIGAAGQAPEPLPHLLAPPELIGPEIGERVIGTGQPIILQWKPLKDLAANEYYEVKVDYNYVESNPVVKYATRETHMMLPASLYDTPNCGVFNWQVTLMQQTGVEESGEPKGKALSYESLYRYVEWLHPLGADMPFTPICPNPQT